MASPSLSLRYSTFGCVKIAICRVWNLCKKRIQIKCLWSPWKNSLVLCYVSEFVLEATITAGNCFCFVADFVQNRGELIGHFKGMISSLFQVSAHGQNHLRSSLKKVLVIFPLFLSRIWKQPWQTRERDYLAKETSVLKLKGIFQLIRVNWPPAWGFGRGSKHRQFSPWECAFLKAPVYLRPYFCQGWWFSNRKLCALHPVLMNSLLPKGEPDNKEVFR